MDMEIEDIRAKAEQFEKRSMRAYWVVIGLTVLFAAAFLRNLITLPDPALKAGTAWVLVAICWVGWRIVRKGPTKIRPAEPCFEYVRRELIGKREGLLWIRRLILFLSPGIVTLWWGGGPVYGARAFGVQSEHLLRILGGPVSVVGLALVLAFEWFAFSREIKKVDREIEELSSWTG